MTPPRVTEGRVASLCVSARKGEKKRPVERATFIAGFGIEADAHAGPWHRQVSLLAAEDIEEVRRSGLPGIGPGDFAENVVLAGVDLGPVGLGSRIRVGRAILSVTQIGKACHARCHIFRETGDCIMPRRGLFATVEEGGEAAVNDPAAIESLVPRSLTQAAVLAVDGGTDGKDGGDSARSLGTFLEESLGAHVFAAEVLPADPAELARRLAHYRVGHSMLFIVIAAGRSRRREPTPRRPRQAPWW